MTRAAPSGSAEAREGLPVLDRTRVGRFAIVCLELALLVLVIRTFRIEEPFGFVSLAPVILGGFLVHSLLPMRLRMPVFVLLGMAAAGVVLGPRYGAVLVAAVLGMVTLCHLPLPYGVRVALVAAAGVTIGLARVDRLPSPGLVSSVVLPLVGSIFMFRMIIYLYDLRNERGPVTIWQRLGYFFLLPNICFPLFPVVDYDAFKRTYYDSDALAIYQKGLLWMGRGVVHILAYRIIYQHILPSLADVADLGGVVQYMLATYGLYLRISGQFHLIIGILCLFGLNLPESHHLYYLATDFNDYWRRINIYWKDFMMKLFFYPMMVRFKRFGMTTALVASTLVVFLATWLLHSYQWFWLRGAFPITGTDMVFWGTLGALVVVNTLREARRGRRRVVKGAWDPVEGAKNSMRVVGMFVTMCVLWSLWSSPSVATWLQMVGRGARSSASEWLLVVGGIAAFVLAGLGVQYARSRGLISERRNAQPPFGRAAMQTALASLALLVIGQPFVQSRLGDDSADLIASIKDERLNAQDTELMDRGYYEGLLESPRFTSALWQVRRSQPADWVDIRELDAVEFLNDALEFQLLPSREAEFKGAPFHTNSWGMRDAEYARDKPAGTHRTAFLGASYEMGSGVADDEGYEPLVEARLNAEGPGGAFDRYEILNFSVGGYSIVQSAIVARRKAAAFDPDVMLYVIHGSEGLRLWIHVSNVLAKQGSIGIPALDSIITAAGVTPGMKWEDIEPRLRSHLDEFIEWGLAEIAAVSRENGIIPAVVYVPATEETREMVARDSERLLALADEFGFVTFSVGPVFSGHRPEAVRLAPFDSHPNEIGHQLLAERLYQEMMANAAALAMTGA